MPGDTLKYYWYSSNVKTAKLWQYYHESVLPRDFGKIVGEDRKIFPFSHDHLEISRTSAHCRLHFATKALTFFVDRCKDLSKVLWKIFLDPFVLTELRDFFFLTLKSQDAHVVLLESRNFSNHCSTLINENNFFFWFSLHGLRQERSKIWIKTLTTTSVQSLYQILAK